MTVKTYVLRPDLPEWDDVLGRMPHDFYHRAAYHAFSETQGDGKGHLAVHEEGGRIFAWPYLLRPLDDAYFDATTVYGYTGPVGLGLDDGAFVARAWSALCKVWREQRVVSVFTRFHPGLENAQIARGLHGADVPIGGELVVPGRTVLIDATLEEADRRAKYTRILRQDVQKAERNGLVVSLDKDWHFFDVFKKLYRATMKKNQAAVSYDFSDEYFDALRGSLDGVARLAVAQINGEIAGTLLFTVHGRFAAAHLAGTDPAFDRLSPFKCLIDRTTDLARALGAETLHLGSGRGGKEDSLFDFKARFSDQTAPFVLGRWIIDAEACEKLTFAAHQGSPVDPSFFPPYRATALANKVPHG